MIDQSFGKDFRLLVSRDFTYLKVGSKSLSRPFVRAYFKKTRVNSDKTRIGFSITKKVGKANVRTRVRRLFRESFRISTHKYLGLDVLIVVSPSIFKKITPVSKAESYLLNSFNELMENLSRHE